MREAEVILSKVLDDTYSSNLKLNGRASALQRTSAMCVKAMVAC